ncbi:MAG: hypothetical protein RID25_12375, partial [Cyclobacteriaceae bacterium]
NTFGVHCPHAWSQYRSAYHRCWPGGRFHEPREYNGEWRCDTHPRASNDGKLICIDSTHGGNGRQMYLIDISELKLT